MPDSIWNATLEEFRARLASIEPAPAGVSTLAVSACLALGLFEKVLQVTRKRKDFRGDPQKIEELLASTRQEAQRLRQCADEDITAYREYMATRRSPQEAAALRKAIDVPMAAARSATAALGLCQEAVTLVPASVAADLGAVAALLLANVRATLLSVDSNLKQVTGAAHYETVRRERHDLESRALAQADPVLALVRHAVWPKSTKAGDL